MARPAPERAAAARALPVSGAPLLLATLNARWAHASLALRYLLANLGDLRAEAALLELETGAPRQEIVERILELEPRVLALSVYVWNVSELTTVVADLKRLRPDLVVVVGGPEVSHEAEDQELCRLADVVVQGEADLVFPALARALLAGERPAQKVVAAPLPALDQVRLPYDGEYGQDDLAKRVLYVEASRGCPYRCEFCLSALDVPVRQFPLEPLLESLDRAIARGARRVKLVDRTFNLAIPQAVRILELFLERAATGVHVHFEMVPDRLPPALRDVLRRFPPGSIQLEVGIQTFTPGVNKEVSRFQDDAKAEDNLRFLRDETDVHVHADLLFGLPGETLESFGASFDRLLPLVPGDIQLGILKRLRGTPIVRHEKAGRLAFSPTPPYDVLATDTVSARDVRRVARAAKTFELYRGSGEHPRALARLLGAGPSAWAELLAFSDRAFARTGRTHSLALPLRCELVFDWLVHERGQDPREVAALVEDDFYRGAKPRAERLPFLEPFVDLEAHRALQRANRGKAHPKAPRYDAPVKETP